MPDSIYIPTTDAERAQRDAETEAQRRNNALYGEQLRAMWASQAAPPQAAQSDSPPPPAPTVPAPAAADMAGAGGGSPAMAGLSQVAAGVGTRPSPKSEGWSNDGGPDLAVPKGRMLPASSRALAQLVSAQGRAY